MKQRPWTRATIGDLHRYGKWLWFECANCGHRRPVPLAQFVIRFGPAEPGETRKRVAVCRTCKQRRAIFQIPKMERVAGGMQVEPFPAIVPVLLIAGGFMLLHLAVLTM